MPEYTNVSFYDASVWRGILLCFGYGQGTGQALNIGKNFDAGMGASGTYASMGLALAALGFLTASVVGVVYLNHLRRHGKIKPVSEQQGEDISLISVQSKDEAPMNESVDKLSTQVALVFLVYMLAYGLMYLIGNALLGTDSGMTGTVYGFNFLFGVMSAVVVKAAFGLLKKKNIIVREYTNTFLLNRISGFAFDVMIVAGICAIQIQLISTYLGLILLLGAAGAVITFFYLRFICKKLFPDYEHEQFLAFFGMLTGTASTGMILLREADADFMTPVSENLVYQNFPAIVLALPLLVIANQLTTNAGDAASTLLTLFVITGIFIVLNIVLFRKFIFRRKAGNTQSDGKK